MIIMITTQVIILNIVTHVNAIKCKKNEKYKIERCKVTVWNQLKMRMDVFEEPWILGF